jgi:hypothetical protein
MRIFETCQKVIKTTTMRISDIIRVTQFLNLLTGLLVPLVDKNVMATDDEYEKYFIFSMVWAMAGVVEHSDRLAFHEHLV